MGWSYTGRHVPAEIQATIEDALEVLSLEEPGAREYFMHSVLCDWPDDVCLTIVARIFEAMKPRYSKFIVYEIVIPATGADCQATAVDWMMMVMFSSSERTEDDWLSFFERGGLKVRNIWSMENILESLIECELAAPDPYRSMSTCV
ncbi:Uu.00g082310.m01.CDS01 [Anthostomella pinea]|uniref:Uu.00g082310.m01.CDS01 n=1 Tax=Anthostomella pinea TaxID=933095 RepID=A0AAI8VMI0_9PEZI|nr:Uu.00g082310.m01.CDS01 [Anthostomella pinea]